MKRILLNILIISYFLSCKESAGPEPDPIPTWILISTENSGLPSNAISKIVRDHNGNLWIGTDAGLVKFDSKNWAIYDTDNSGLPHNDILDLLIDSKDRIWIGTSMGLALFDGNGWVVYNESNSQIPGNYIGVIESDMEDNIWVFCEGLYKFDMTTWTKIEDADSILYSTTITAIHADETGAIWLGACSPPGIKRGLYKFDGHNWFVYDQFTSDPYGDNILCILGDELNTLWLGTDHPLIHFKESRYKLFYMLEPEFPSYITSLIKDQYGILWLTRSYGGFAKFDGQNFTSYEFTKFGIPFEPYSQSIAVDSDNNKWIATSGWGIILFNEDGVTIH